MDPNVVIEHLVRELGIEESRVKSALSLFGRGATVPFIARYRKEATGGLDEVELRAIADGFSYFAELEARKETVIRSIAEQGKMTDDILKKVRACVKKHVLEDIYLPFKPKERTPATIARERGLEGLARAIRAGVPPATDRRSAIASYVDPKKGVATPESALEGALEIVIEEIAEDVDVRNDLRALYAAQGVVVSKARPQFAGTKTKYEDYYAFSQLLSKVPSHRLLAIRRGTKEDVLTWEVVVPAEAALKAVLARVVRGEESAFRKDLISAVSTAFHRRLDTAMQADAFRMKLKGAEREAIVIFQKNLRNLLLAPPAGSRVIMGIDPGVRTGCKVAVIDRNGNFLEYRQIFPFDARCRKASADALHELVKRYGVEVIATGNGTASRETAAFVRAVVSEAGLGVNTMTVSEAGASVYSASVSARLEFPDLDITVKGAISIARRLQDPLSELVKIDPKSIGVGQYQHDVNPAELKHALDAVVESCVNFVGVDLNTASAELLSYVSGIGPSLARGIVRYRVQRGRFANKGQLNDVPGLGEKAFEQCAGFLKIPGGTNPLDASTIHPERFELVGRMASALGLSINALLGNDQALAHLELGKFVSADVGMPTLNDIVRELAKPGLDPREDFTSVAFSDAVSSLADVSVGSVLAGVVTNVTGFGAFVDIGVHQDGLVHISKMGRRFVEDPHEVVSVGDRVKVKVVSVDRALGRIGLEVVAG